MFTFIIWSFLSCFHSIQGLGKLPEDILAATEIAGDVSSQILPSGNDSKFQEFSVIFNHYVNRILLEKENRQALSRLTAVNTTDDDENQDLRGSLEWQSALSDALTEENITAELNKPLNVEIIEDIQFFARNPENLKALHLQKLDSDKNESITISEDSAGRDSENATAEENLFWDDAPTRRIFRGLRTKIQLYPFVVSVLVLSSFACAGSIIKNDLVITAASCLQLAHNNRFFRENPIMVEVRVGSIFFVVGGETVPVTDIYFHPLYDPQSLRNNLAVMRLRRVLNFRHKSVKKIDFDKSPSALPENTPPITILGWGARSESNKLYYRARLHVTNLDFYDRESCGEVYGKKFVGRTNFCAGFISRGEGACNHDVGDPGVSGRYLVGVTSFGSPLCGQPDTPTVFTKLGYYADWIQEIMDQKIPQYSYSTTTRRPYQDLEKHIILYGNDGEDAPIPLQREGVETKSTEDTESVDAHIQIVLDELKKLGIENTASKDLIRSLTIKTEQKEEELPIEDQDPEIPTNTGLMADGPPIHQFVDSAQISDEKKGGALREEGDYEEEFNDKTPEERDWSGSDAHSSTMNSEYRTTKIFDYDATLTMSREIQQSDKENVGRVTKLSAIGLSAKKSTINVNTIQYISKERTRNPKGNVNKSDFKKKHRILKTNLQKKHRMPISTNSQLKNTRKPKDSAKEGVHVVLPNILGNIHPIDLVSGNKKTLPGPHETTTKEDNIQVQLLRKEANNKGFDENILKEHQTDKEEIENPGQLQTELANELADDIVKREIQKLIEQLEISSELNSQINERKHIDNSALGNDVNTIHTDKTEDSNTVLTLLYLTDDEDNKFQQRANYKLDIKEQGLSIDPEPFKRNIQQGNHLVGKSEIYEIFADVLNTVVNKTLE